MIASFENVVCVSLTLNEAHFHERPFPPKLKDTERFIILHFVFVSVVTLHLKLFYWCGCMRLSLSNNKIRCKTDIETFLMDTV